MGIPSFGSGWEGRVVEGKFPLLEWRGGSESCGSFFTVLGGLQQAIIQFILASDPGADAHLAQWNFATGLSHPHIARVLDAGHCVIDDTELVYSVTEFSDATLSRIVRSGTLGPARTKEVFIPVLSALSYLHKNGVVHGHINPSTIQFACAKPKLSIADLFLAGSAKRNIAIRGLYDAPEVHLEGASPASDAWSIVMTMYEAITDAQLLLDLAADDRAQMVQRLPSPFREIVQGCLQVDPERRYTVENILDRLNGDNVASISEVEIPVNVEDTNSAASSIQAGAAPLANQSDSFLLEPAVDEPVVFSKSFERFEEAHLARFRGLPYAAVLIIVLALVPVMVVRGHRSTPRPEVTGKTGAPAISEPVAKKPLTAPAAGKTALENQSTTPVLQVAPRAKPDVGQFATENLPETAHQSESPKAFVNQPPQRATPVARPTFSNVETNGSVVKRVLPDVSPGAFEGNPILVEVQVRVSVNQDGAVSDVESISSSPGNYFARLAERAARSWQFRPPIEKGKPGRSVWMLRFYFARDQTEATAEREQGL